MKKGEEPARPRQLEDECAELGVMDHEMSELESVAINVSGQETIVGTLCFAHDAYRVQRAGISPNSGGGAGRFLAESSMLSAASY